MGSWHFKYLPVLHARQNILYLWASSWDLLNYFNLIMNLSCDLSETELSHPCLCPVLNNVPFKWTAFANLWKYCRILRLQCLPSDMSGVMFSFFFSLFATISIVFGYWYHTIFYLCFSQITDHFTSLSLWLIFLSIYS